MSGPLPDEAYERLLEVARALAPEAPGQPGARAPGLARYELRGELGRGGMGVVHDAWDRELGRAVALKVLVGGAGSDASARERFLREARAAARLVHPHIAAVYDAGPEAIAMQRVAGHTLAERSPADPRALVALLRDAALAIHYAHGEGVVHRDLKPANLMVEPGRRPHVFVMDFGLAKERSVDASLSLSGSVVGTPGFMAPEQAAGRGEAIGPATDVYGLGATLYACLAGRPPFEDDDLYRLLRRVVEEEPVPLGRLARVDRDLERIVAKAMAKEPERRYASALAFAGDLDRWSRGEPIEARPPSPGYLLRRFVSRRQGAIVASAAAALLSLVLASPFFLQARARRLAAERERQTTSDVLALSRRVDEALRNARATLVAGAGYERGAHALLQGEIERCEAFLAERDVEHVRFFLGRLLRAQGRYREALASFDRAAGALEGTEMLTLERGLALAALYREGVPVLGEEPPPELEDWRRRGAADLELALAEPSHTTTPDRLFAEAQLAWLRGDPEASVARHREVLEMDRGYLESHLSLARLCLLEGRDDLAMRHSIEATDLLRGAGRAFLPQGGAARSVAGLAPERELVPVDGLDELLVDFDLLLQQAPSDARAYGMRGQVQIREALRALERGDAGRARTTLELAVRQFGAVLTLEEESAAALADRAVARTQLARLVADAGEPRRAGDMLAAALADYEAAIAGEPSWAFLHYDLALLLRARARLLALGLRGEEARAEAERARDASRTALRLAEPDHPWRGRFEALAAELP